eukprot:604055-Hanusia_phi.AAC.1
MLLCPLPAARCPLLPPLSQMLIGPPARQHHRCLPRRSTRPAGHGSSRESLSQHSAHGLTRSG